MSQSFTVGGADLMQATVLYPLAQEGMRSGLYMPNTTVESVQPAELPVLAAPRGGASRLLVG